MELIASSPVEPGEGTSIHVLRHAVGEGERFGAHQHDLHQLAWASTGVVVAEVAGTHWALPPTLALWVPGGTHHDVGASRAAQLHSLYLQPDNCPLPWAHEVTVVSVSPLLRELIAHLTTLSACDEARRRVEALALDLLRPARTEVLDLPLPLDARARELATRLLEDPADDRTLDNWGHVVGASRRTLARLFVAETGLTFLEWRTQVRLRAALIALADGVPAAVVARRVGYRSASAFTAAFQRNLGRTPATYWADAG